MVNRPVDIHLSSRRWRLAGTNGQRSYRRRGETESQEISLSAGKFIEWEYVNLPFPLVCRVRNRLANTVTKQKSPR